MKLLSKNCLAVAVASLGLVASVAAQAPRPNIIFILVDDLGYGDLGCFWQDQRTAAKKFDTPAIDAMAAEGAKLTHHYVAASVCAPSRASFIQGRHQGHSDVRDSQFDKALPINHTVASTLKAAGYRTILIGKHGLAGGEGSTNLSGTGSQNLASHPLAEGFDRFFGYLFHGDGHEHYPRNGTSDKSAHIYDDYQQITNASTDLYSTDAWTAAAKKEIIEEVNDGDTEPFFMYLSYETPHFKMQRPATAYPPLNNDGNPLTGGIQWTTATDGSGKTRFASTATGTGSIDGFTHPDIPSGWATSEKQHVGMIRRIDESVADIIRTLQDLGIDDDTMIVFASDNGPHNEGNNPRTFESFANMEGVKRDMWEAGIRTPTVVRWPGHIAGSTNDPNNIHEISNPSGMWDWMPTFCELAGVPAPGWCDGVSLAPTLTGNGTQREKGYLYFEFSNSGSTPNWGVFPNHRNETKGQMQCLRIGNHMGIRTGITTGSENFQIYDVTTDPGEANNLAASLPALQTRMKYLALAARSPGAGVSRPYDDLAIPAKPPVASVDGLSWKTYSDVGATWQWVPEFRDLTAVASGISPTVDLSVRPADDHFGIAFEGYIDVPTAGAYKFYLGSDTGANLWIHDRHVIDDDFNHTGDATSKVVQLEQGLHPFRLHYRHTTGDRTLAFDWSGPGLPRAPLTGFFSAVPSSPAAGDDSASTPRGKPVLIDVLANDLDDGLPAALSISSVSVPDFGSATIQSGKILYTPAVGFTGQATFTYTVTDGSTPDSATVTITVLTPTPPVAGDDEVTTSTDMPVEIDVLVNDSDDGVPSPLSITFVSTPDFGTASIASGKILYTPPVGFAGDAAFTYSITDGNSSDSASVTVTVIPYLAPVATSDFAYVAPGSFTAIEVLLNDSDDGFPETISIASVSNPSVGSISQEGNVILYSAPLDFTGGTSFTYQISDGGAQTSSATVTIVSTPADDWWLPLDEAFGSVANDATGKTGTLANFSESPWTKGKLGNALSFSGGSERIDLTDFKGILGATPRTLSAWIKTSGTGQMPIIGWGQNSAGNKWTFMVQNGHLRLEVTSGFLEGTKIINDNQWHHVAVSFENDGTPDALDIKLYVDGILETSFNNQTARTINTLASLDVRVGSDVQNRVFTGLIDDPRIFSSALSGNQIQGLATQTPVLNTRTLWFYQNLGKDDPQTVDWDHDSDFDGLSAFAEFALGGSPFRPDTGILPVLALPPGGLSFVFNRRIAGMAAGNYLPETSTDLLPESWQPLNQLAAVPHPTLDGFEEVTVALDSSDPVRFVRLRIEP